MRKSLLEDREFKAGTTGWTVDDLDDPKIERLWDASNFEIVEGVLAEMPAAYYEGGVSLYRLMKLVDRHLEREGIDADWSGEVDFVIETLRLSKPDAMLLLKEDADSQARANAKTGKSKLKYGRIRIAPTLIVESVSPGHEKHDRVTKRKWYAEFGVKNYWILDGFRQTLECLILDGDDYRLDVMGRKSEKIRPAAFPGLVLPLGKLWV